MVTRPRGGWGHTGVCHPQAGTECELWARWRDTHSRETLLKVRWAWGCPVSRSRQSPGAPLDTVGGPGGRDEPRARPRRDRGALVQGTACRVDGRPGALWRQGRGPDPGPREGCALHPVTGGSPSPLRHEDSRPKSSEHFCGLQGLPAEKACGHPRAGPRCTSCTLTCPPRGPLPPACLLLSVPSSSL